MWLTALSFLKSKLGFIDYILIVCLIAAFGWSASLKIETWSLKSDLSKCQTDNGILTTNKRLYEQAIDQGKEDANVSKEEAKKETVIIQEKAKVEIKRIKELPYDSNKTDHENAISHAEHSGI